MPEFNTRVVIVLCLLGLGALAWVFYRRWLLHRAVRDQFKAFRERAVVLMDQLDSLRQRHKAMTTTDPDFEVPMTGATRELYDQINENLDRLWDRWLRVMEIWNRAQERLSSGTGLTSGPAAEAKALLEGGEIEALVRETDHCQKELDRLNQAHELARSQLHEVREELASVQHTVTLGTGVLLPSDRHHEALQKTERALSDAELRIASDPIGAQELILRTRQRLGQLAELPGPDTGWSLGGQSSYLIFDEVSAAAERMRTLASRLWSTSVLSLFVRAWLLMAAVFLFFAILLSLLPLVLFFVVAFLMLAAFWYMARAQVTWFWHMARPSSQIRTRVERRSWRRRPPGESL